MDKEVYKAGESKREELIHTGYHPLSISKYRYLEEYGNSLNETAAKKAADINGSTLSRWKKDADFQIELAKIHEVWYANLRMSSHHASAKHIELMDKFEKDYDSAFTVEDKAKMASSLAKMSDSALRASGKYTNETVAKATNVVINIDLGDDSDNMRNITIEGNSEPCK